MKFKTFSLLAVFALFFILNGAIAKAADGNQKKGKIIEANVWLTEDGQKHFTCPVTGGEDVVTEKTLYSDVDGKRYYHCCAGCPEKFQANPSKYLKSFAVPGNVVKVDADGNHFQCPVSGEMGLVSDKTLYADYDGKRYYFCCEGCKPRFEKELTKYLKAEGKKGGSQHEHHEGMKKMLRLNCNLTQYEKW